jgi:arsenite methyltransferase
VLRGELPSKLKERAAVYAGCVAGAMQYEEYLNVIREAGFIGLEVKSEHQFINSDAVLSEYLGHEDAELYRQSHVGMHSITVVARKPDVA